MATPNCWIGVVARAHALEGKARGFVMFAHGQHSAVKRVQPGDWFAYYAPTQTLGGKDSVRRFVAIGTIAQGEPRALPMAPDISGWQRPADYLDASEADIYPLLPRFDFVTDHTHWGMYFRKSLFQIGPADFSLIAEAMSVGQIFTIGD